MILVMRTREIRLRIPIRVGVTENPSAKVPVEASRGMKRRSFSGGWCGEGAVHFFAHRREGVAYRKKPGERDERMKAKKNKRERSPQVRAP
jgi:hypothetical protein